MAIESNQPTRRDILKLGAAAVGVPIATSPTTSTSTRATSALHELLRDRHFQHGFLLLDPKQGKPVYTCAADDIATESTHDRKWATFDRDLLPLIRRGIETTWSRGFLTHSRRIADYHIAGFFLGWEVPGIFDVEVQIRDLCLRV